MHQQIVWLKRCQYLKKMPKDVNWIDANEKVIFQNCAPFTDWISEINSTQYTSR